MCMIWIYDTISVPFRGVVFISLYIKRGCACVRPLPFDPKKCYFSLLLFCPPPITNVLYLPCKNKKFPKRWNMILPRFEGAHRRHWKASIVYFIDVHIITQLGINMERLYCLWADWGRHNFDQLRKWQPQNSIDQIWAILGPSTVDYIIYCSLKQISETVPGSRFHIISPIFQTNWKSWHSHNKSNLLP